MQVLHSQRVLKYPAGQIVQMEQEPLDRVLVVIEGVAKVRSFQHNGYEELLNLLGPGDCTGITCLFDVCTAWGDVVALTELKVLRVACSDLFQLLEQDPEMALCCMALQQDQLLGVKRRVVERRLTTHERLLGVLQEPVLGDNPATVGTVETDFLTYSPINSSEAAALRPYFAGGGIDFIA